MRRILAAMLLGAVLTACSAPVAQQPGPTSAPAAGPTVVAIPSPISAPTMASTTVPTGVPTEVPTTAPAPTPVALDLPALDSGAWLELGQGSFLGNGYLTRVLYLPTDQPGNDAFAVNVAGGMTAVAEAVAVVQEVEGSPLTWLRADRSGVSGDVLLWRPTSGSPAPTAYMVALDPGSTYLISLLPLGPDGAALDRVIPLNWSDAANALRVAPVPDGADDTTVRAP